MIWNRIWYYSSVLVISENNDIMNFLLDLLNFSFQDSLQVWQEIFESYNKIRKQQKEKFEEWKNMSSCIKVATFFQLDWFDYDIQCINSFAIYSSVL